MPKKQVNWPAIKKRYLQGETPKALENEYQVTAKQISNKAYEENWTSKRQQISEKIESLVEEDLAELCSITVSVHLDFLKRLRGQMHYIENPFLFDGERPNGLFQTAMNNAVKIYQSAIKAQDDEKNTLPSNTSYKREFNQSFPNTAPNGNYASKPVLPLASSDTGETLGEDDDRD